MDPGGKVGDRIAPAFRMPPTLRGRSSRPLTQPILESTRSANWLGRLRSCEMGLRLSAMRPPHVAVVHGRVRW
jgi:hypothetical protein